jgi:hypothetical protein
MMAELSGIGSETQSPTGFQPFSVLFWKAAKTGGPIYCNRYI